MKIAYVGNFRHDHCTEVHVARSLRALGHEVAPLQEESLATSLSVRRRREPVAPPNADLLLYTRTHSVGLPPAATRYWRHCEAEGVTTASFHLDLFFGLYRERLVRRKDPLFTTQFVFTADGDPHPWEKYGVNHFWLPAGVVADECRRERSRSEWRGVDVAFVGSGGDTYHREWPWRSELLGALRERYGDRFRQVPAPGKPAVRGRALNRLYASVPVIVGDALALRGRSGRYWSDRVYETLGRGGFPVLPRIDALVEEIGLESAGWYEIGNVDSVFAAVDHWLAHPTEREARRAHGQQVVVENCTYEHRAAAMLAILERERLAV